jgi:hypothetical protein
MRVYSPRHSRLHLMRLHLLDIAAATVVLLGLYVMAGWIVGSEAWVRVVPNSAAAGVNTAFLFLVVGICLFSIRRTRCSHAAVWTAWLLVLLPSSVLVEHVFRINLGIDWVAFHAWMNDGNPYPGRMAPNACSGDIFGHEMEVPSSSLSPQERAGGEGLWSPAHPLKPPHPHPLPEGEGIRAHGQAGLLFLH